MKMIKRIFSYVCVLVIGITLFSVNSFAFKGTGTDNTHGFVTEKGIELLINTMGSTYSTFYSTSTRSTLKTYSVKPDEDDTGTMFDVHFYNPNTGKNFNGGSTTALSKFESHYDSAVTHYKAGRTTDAWEQLGRALHFLADLNTPVHTNNQSLLDAGTGILTHTSFENLVVDRQANVSVTMTTGNFTYYKNNTVNAIGKSSASMANDNFVAMKNKTSTRETVADNSVINATRAIAGVLYKFTLDVQ